MAAHQSGWILASTEQNIRRPSSRDPIPSLHPFPGVIKKICLRLCSEDKHFNKETMTWISHVQL